MIESHSLSKTRHLRDRDLSQKVPSGVLDFCFLDSMMLRVHMVHHARLWSIMVTARYVLFSLLHFTSEGASR